VSFGGGNWIVCYIHYATDSIDVNCRESTISTQSVILY